MLIHTGHAAHNRDTCGKLFTQNCNLTQHILIHTGAKQYSCGIWRIHKCVVSMLQKCSQGVIEIPQWKFCFVYLRTNFISEIITP